MFNLESNCRKKKYKSSISFQCQKRFLPPFNSHWCRTAPDLAYTAQPAPITYYSGARAPPPVRSGSRYSCCSMPASCWAQCPMSTVQAVCAETEPVNRPHQLKIHFCKQKSKTLNSHSFIHFDTKVQEGQRIRF